MNGATVKIKRQGFAQLKRLLQVSMQQWWNV